MEEKKYYKTSEKEDLIVPIKNIILDEGMTSKVKGEKYTKLGKLDDDRLNRVFEAFDNDIGIPPIKVVQIEKEKKIIVQIYIPPSQRKFSQDRYKEIVREDRYKVVNGRHRVVGSLLRGYNYIPIKLVEDYQ